MLCFQEPAFGPLALYCLGWQSIHFPVLTVLCMLMAPQALIRLSSLISKPTQRGFHISSLFNSYYGSGLT
jgi:hypothetical protein